MADSSNSNEETFETTAAMQTTPQSSSESLNAESVENPQVESSEVEAPAENVVAETYSIPDQVAEEPPNSADSSMVFHTQQDQQTYANLEPILVAMELGHEILQNNGEQLQTDGGDDKDTVVQMDIQHTDDNDDNIIQSDTSTDHTSNVVSITQEQLASLFANSGTAGGNVIVTSDGNGGQGGLALATILQDVVSGIQQNGGTTVLADSTGGPGSYYLVTQGGTIPIVMPSSITSSSDTTMNLVQASSSGTTTFVTVNQDNLPEGVEAIPTTVQSSEAEDSNLTAVEQGTVDSSEGGAPATETTDHELATAAAAVENDRATQIDEAAVSEPVPVVTSSVKRRLSNGPRVCTQCNKAFKYPSDLKKHLQIHTDIKKFKCEECNRFFRRLHQLVVHQRIHSGEKPYICKHCGTAFRHDSTLTMHVRTRHEHKRPFKCTYCEHTFGRLSHLRKHVKKVCGPNKQEKQSNTVFQCKYCDEVCTSKIELRKHNTVCEKKENKSKPSQVALHVCNICNKDFASPYNVRRHQLTHSDDRPFECEYCNKSFKEKSSLTKHVKRVHFGKAQDDDSLDENSAGIVVGINNRDQHLEVVSMHQNEENLLAASLQRDVSSSNENNHENVSTVDSSALVQVAASVMVEELLHGSEDQNHEASPTTVVPSHDETMFVADTDKADEKIQEAHSYDGDEIIADPSVSCMAPGTEEAMSSLTTSCLENTPEDTDSSDVQQVSTSQFEDKPTEGDEVECSSEAMETLVEPVILSSGPADEEVVTSSENTNEQIL